MAAYSDLQTLVGALQASAGANSSGDNETVLSHLNLADGRYVQIFALSLTALNKQLLFIESTR